MEQESKNSFGDKLKAWGKFFISPYFIKNILIYIATIILFFVIVIMCLKWYTHHDQQISVPAVENLSIAEAEKLIRERGLVPQVIDCTYTSTVKPGTIIPGGQQPTAGYAVKKGRTVYLTYMAYTKEPTTMPKIVGESIETAKSELARCGLIVGKITERDGKYKNILIEVRYKGAAISFGHQLHKGDIVDLVVDNGKESEDADNTPTIETSVDEEEF